MHPPYGREPGRRRAIGRREPHALRPGLSRLSSVADRTYRGVNRLVAFAFRLAGFRFTVSGLDRLPTAGPAVVAANHTGFLDFTFVGYAARRRGRLVRFLCKASMFEVPIAGRLLRRMRHIPVRRDSGAMAFRRAVDALEDGQVVGVFPEATISRSWLLRGPFKPGAAAMALKCDAPLIPVIVWGGHRVLTVDGHRTLRRRLPITIAVGEPLAPTGTITELTERLQAQMADLLDEVIDGYLERVPPGEDPWWVPYDRGGTAPDPVTAARLDAEAVARLGDALG